jgi:hypothetical protein
MKKLMFAAALALAAAPVAADAHPVPAGPGNFTGAYAVGGIIVAGVLIALADKASGQAECNASFPGTVYHLNPPTMAADGWHLLPAVRACSVGPNDGQAIVGIVN